MSIIQDGTGRGFQAEVSSRNELKTVSSTLSTFERATLEEEAFNINTLFLPYTIGADSALLFVQNNEAQPIILQGWFIGTTGGSGGDPIVQVFGGVTGFSAGTPVDVPVVNRNVGSARAFNITAQRADAAGRAFTGGTADPVLYQTQPNSGRVFGNVFITVPRGGSVGVSILANGSTGINLYTGFTGFVVGIDLL
jgi:hypothetical protein